MQQTVKQIKRVYFSITAMRWLATGLVLPIFVLFMQSRGLGLMQIGIIMGAYSVTVVLLELPTGGLADAVGRKKVSLLANSIDILASIIIFFSFSFWGFLLGMLFMGVSRALNSGALDAWYVDSLQAADPAVDLQPALAQAGTVTLIALGSGTLVGGALPTLFAGLPDSETAIISPFSINLATSLVVQFLLLVAIARAVHESPRSEAEAADWRAGFRSVPGIIGDALTLTRQNQNLPYLMGAAVIGGFALAGVETFWQPHFSDLLGGSIGQSWLFGLVMAVSFLAGVGGNILSIPASKKLNDRFALLAALARGLQSVALLAMALLQPLIGFVGGFWAFYLGNALNDSPHNTLVNNEIPADRRSAMLSTQSLAFYIGSFLGSVLLGAVAESRSIAAAWIVAAVVSMVSLVLYARVARQQPGANLNHDESITVPDVR
ncbi:MAG: MFS transporter [Candidatus Promineifilaceae bacterium]